MDDEYIRSALDFISSQKDASGLRSNFHIQGYSEAAFLGNPNITLGSWIGRSSPFLQGYNDELEKRTELLDKLSSQQQ
ncbi:hypothetical protein CFP56_027628 [Quercus suber]|uniref:Uncharacterized protein n=1 Tax=Quercus suber TaxID=58331 RepID=A0AAW0JX58_QUESU